MRLGFFTAALPGMDLTQVATWAAESKFQTLEIACWPAGKAERRYAGVSHIDVDSWTRPARRRSARCLADLNLDISSLGFYPNPLHPDKAVREAAFAHIKKVVDAAVLLEVPIVGTFIGADQSKSAADNLETFAKLWPPIIKYAGKRGIKIAIENCPMLWHDTWPGGQNVAYSPSIWKQDVRDHPGRQFRPQLRPVPPDLAIHRRGQTDPRVQRPDLPCACQGHGDRPRKARAGRDLLGRCRLGDSAPAGSRRDALGSS